MTHLRTQSNTTHGRYDEDEVVGRVVVLCDVACDEAEVVEEVVVVKGEDVESCAAAVVSMSWKPRFFIESGAMRLRSMRHCR